MLFVFRKMLVKHKKWLLQRHLFWRILNCEYRRTKRFGTFTVKERDQKAKNTTKKPKRLLQKVGNVL